MADHVDRAVRRDAGRPLDPPTRNFFEPRFDADLGHVRVHTGDEADASARALDAEAYSVGPHLVFRSGRYQPDTTPGRRLLAHELAHTFQSPPTTPRRARMYRLADAEGSDERRAATAATAALSPAPPSEAWRLAVPPGGSQEAGAVRREESESFLSGLQSGADQVGSWVEGSVRDVGSAVGEGIEEAGEVVEAGVESAREGFASIVERVSPFLARMVREGPITVLTEWIGERLGAWLKGLLGDLSPGRLVGDLGRWLGTFVSALGEDIRAEGGLDCWLFARIVDLFAGLGRAILDNPVTQAIGSMLSAIHDVVAEVAGLWVQAEIRRIVTLWTGLRELGSTLRGWLGRVRAYSERAVDWVVDELGLGGEGGVLSRLQDLAQSAWRTIQEDVAPAALTGLRKAGRALYAMSGLRGAADAIAVARELWTAIQWLWEHRNDPDLVASAEDDPDIRNTFLPGALRRINEFADTVARHVDWLHRQLSPLVDAVESAVGSLEDLPVIRTLASLLRSLAKGLRALWTRVSKELPRFSKLIRKVAAAVWHVGKTILAVWAVLFILALNPWLIPFVIVGLFALGAWLLLPDCYKEPVIDLILDMAITALRGTSDLPLFGPLWSLLKPAFVAFLERAKGWERERKVAVTERVAELMLWSGPDFALGWVWGVLKGFWEALTDVFVMVWMALKGLWWLTKWADRVVRQALELPARPEPAAGQPVATGEAPETLGAAEATAEGLQVPPGVIERLRRFVDEVRGPAREIVDNFMDAAREHFRGRPGRTFDVLREKLGELWDRAQESIEEQGASLADRTTDAILAPDAEEISGDVAFNIGEFIGWLAATIFAEILLAAISAGIIPVARSVKWMVDAIEFVGDVLFGWIFRLVAKLGGMVLRLGRRLARTGGTVGGALGRVIGAIDTVGAAIRRMAADVLEAFRPAGRGAAETAATRGGRESLEGVAVRAEAEPAAREVAEAERRAASGEAGARGPETTGRMDTAALSDADRLVEYRWIEANPHRLQPSTEPGYVWEVRLPGNEHVWRIDPNGRWCRFSNGTCYTDVVPPSHLPSLSPAVRDAIEEGALIKVGPDGRVFHADNGRELVERNGLLNYRDTGGRCYTCNPQYYELSAGGYQRREGVEFPGGGEPQQVSFERIEGREPVPSNPARPSTQLGLDDELHEIFAPYLDEGAVARVRAQSDLYHIKGQLAEEVAYASGRREAAATPAAMGGEVQFFRGDEVSGPAPTRISGGAAHAPLTDGIVGEVYRVNGTPRLHIHRIYEVKAGAGAATGLGRQAEWDYERIRELGMSVRDPETGAWIDFDPADITRSHVTERSRLTRGFIPEDVSPTISRAPTRSYTPEALEGVSDESLEDAALMIHRQMQEERVPSAVATGE